MHMVLNPNIIFTKQSLKGKAGNENIKIYTGINEDELLFSDR